VRPKVCNRLPWEADIGNGFGKNESTYIKKIAQMARQKCRSEGRQPCLHRVSESSMK
jgi:hypothetical protein